MRRHFAARRTELHAGQHPRLSAADGNQPVRDPTDARVARSDFERRFGCDVAPHREAFTATPNRQRDGGVVAVAHEGIRTKTSRCGTRSHGQRSDALSRGAETPFAARTDPDPRAEPHPGGPKVVAKIVAELLGAEGIE